VFLGWLFGQNLNLIFSHFELVAIILAVLVARILIFDGSSNWLKGLMLVALYLMLGVGFFYTPGVAPGVAPPRSTIGTPSNLDRRATTHALDRGHDEPRRSP